MNPADNPKEQRRMKGDTEDNTDTMSDTESEDETNPLRDTQQSNGGTEADMSDLIVGVRNETTYYVGNTQNGTAYLVNMCDPDHEDEMTCTCPNYRYRVSPDEDRACKHILAVIEQMPAHVGIEQVAYEGLKRQYDILDSKVDSVAQQLTGIVSHAHENGGTESRTNKVTGQQESVPASDAHGSGQQMQSVTAEEAAEKLQAAYDDAVSGMNVKAINGKVWINKSPDAPDFTFGAFLRDPSQTRYDPDNSPEQYYQNYIDPEDVDEYISEVLE